MEEDGELREHVVNTCIHILNRTGGEAGKHERREHEWAGVQCDWFELSGSLA